MERTARIELASQAWKAVFSQRSPLTLKLHGKDATLRMDISYRGFVTERQFISAAKFTAS